MGAIFFMVFLAIVFFIALFFIVISTTLIVVWKVRKRRGKNPKKWWLVVPTILLIINAIIVMLPVGYISFLRYTNNTAKQPVVYSEPVLYWPMGEYESTTNWFEMDGIKYVRFLEGFSNDPFFLDYSDERLEAPVANIEYDPSDSNSFWGYGERKITAYSKDRMACKHVILVLIDGQAYVNRGSGYEYITGYPVSIGLNHYIIDTVFVD